jgi:hypothetical protein
MSAVKTVALGVLVWAACAVSATADTISSFDSNPWAFFTATDGSSFQPTYGRFIGLGTPVSAPSQASTPVFTPSPVSNPATAPAPTPIAATPTFTSTSAPATPTFSSMATATTSNTPVFATSAPSGGTGTQTADAYLNFGGSSYPESSSLTVGTAQPWYTSPSVTKLFNGSTPTAQQQVAFENQVLQDVQHTFALSNLFPKLTLDPNAPANHTMSIVSGASYGPNPNAIGITDVGRNGFVFVDKFSYANSIDQLATAVSKNMSHELMHAFGVGIHPDTTGTYIDAGTASWSLLTDPNSTFSPAAAALIAATGFGQSSALASTSTQLIDGQQQILSAPVPEPMTVTLWGVGLAGVVLFRRHRRRAAAV